MPAPEEEWMLWAKRLKSSIRAEIDEELRALPSRYAQVAQDTAQVDVLREQIKDLETSHKHVHQSNLALQAQARGIESDSATLDQRLTTESNTWHKTTMHLAKQLEHVVSAFDQFKREAQAAEESRQRELHELRKQIEEHMSNTSADGQCRSR